MTIDSSTQRGLILVSKVLQKLVSGGTFGQKEAYMEPLNNFLSKNEAIMQKYLHDCALFTGGVMQHHEMPSSKVLGQSRNGAAHSRAGIETSSQTNCNTYSAKSTESGGRIWGGKVIPFLSVMSSRWILC